MKRIGLFSVLLAAAMAANARADFWTIDLGPNRYIHAYESITVDIYGIWNGEGSTTLSSYTIDGQFLPVNSTALTYPDQLYFAAAMAPVAYVFSAEPNQSYGTNLAGDGSTFGISAFADSDAPENGVTISPGVSYLLGQFVIAAKGDATLYSVFNLTLDPSSLTFFDNNFDSYTPSILNSPGPEITVIPELGTMALTGLGLGVAGLIARRKTNRSPRISSRRVK